MFSYVKKHFRAYMLEMDLNLLHFSRIALQTSSDSFGERCQIRLNYGETLVWSSVATKTVRKLPERRAN
jgi:hypothetical protein